MGIKLKNLQKNFPNKASVPTELVRLLEYQNDAAGWYSGFFQITDDGRDAIFSWFGKDKKAISKFAVFGSGGDGSLYCFWLYQDRTVEDAPIVFLGSEGEGNTVLANNIREFLSLLAVGYDELGFIDEWEEKNEITPELLKFRKWLKKEFQILPAKNPRKLIERARLPHPDLSSWIDGWIAARD